MTTPTSSQGLSLHNEYPSKADLRTMMDQKPLPVIAPESGDVTGEEPTTQALAVLDAFNNALAADDAEGLKDCFFVEQAYWKDQLALTYHLRTFTDSDVIAASLLETKVLREIIGGFELEGAAQFIPAAPTLQFIDCGLVFKTASPAATCSGKMLLLPVNAGSGSGKTKWKIWILSTWLESLDIKPEDESLLQLPRRQLDGLGKFDTDVFIIGAGNGAIALAARLKALGVESVMAERNAQIGDNWALRYDCMRFHIPTAFCELPYMCYDKHLQAPHLLTRYELADQVRRYVAAFNLNVINSAAIKSTLYDQSSKRWIIRFQTPAGQHTATSKHLVQATGIGSQKPHLPPMADRHLYKGISLHSSQYRNAKQLQDRGAKTVLIIGSANTAFDILEDCHATTPPLRPTIAARSPTYVVPLSYVCSPLSLGAYAAIPVAAADRLFLTLPSPVDAQLCRGLFASFAAAEPDRYDALAAAGFPVVDSGERDGAMMCNLLERAGGHYVDVGGTRLVAEGEVGVKAGTEPVAWVEGGVRFADGSEVRADAVVWCTGFADRDARGTAAEVLGGGGGGGGGGVAEAAEGVLLDHREVAAWLDATWGVDAEGEVRGMWKRHLRVENYWVMGGYTQQHRWHSKTLALQIKAALEGILPPAYRDHAP